MPRAGAPSDPVAVPDPILRAAKGRRLHPVWENELGGLTFQIGVGRSRLFAKWAPRGSGLDLAAEAARCLWAVDYIAAPRVLDLDSDDDGSWMMTEGLDGESAESAHWLRRPEVAVRVVAEGLRHLHDTLPTRTCPFSWSVEHRRAEASARGRPVPDDFPETPGMDQIVVCHGDPCIPNTLIDDTGRCSGHVDLGALGIADRWADIAVATWSTERNYGPGWEDTFLDAYGISADEERTAFYRRLYFT
jgi:kanamycin kinase